jgi:hypothetical protein
LASAGVDVVVCPVVPVELVEFVVELIVLVELVVVVVVVVVVVLLVVVLVVLVVVLVVVVVVVLVVVVVVVLAVVVVVVVVSSSSSNQQRSLKNATEHVPGGRVVGAPPPRPFSSSPGLVSSLSLSCVDDLGVDESRMGSPDSSQIATSRRVCRRHRDGVAHWPLPVMTASSPALMMVVVLVEAAVVVVVVGARTVSAVVTLG